MAQNYGSFERVLRVGEGRRVKKLAQQAAQSSGASTPMGAEAAQLFRHHPRTLDVVRDQVELVVDHAAISQGYRAPSFHAYLPPHR